MLVCTGALGVKSRPGWLLILFVKGVLCKRFSLVGTIRPSFRQCLPLPGRLGRCLPYRGVQSFPPRRWRVCCCARRRTLVPAERSGCACVPRIWKQPTHLGQRCPHTPPLVGMRDVEQFRFVAIRRGRNISKASPLDQHVHSKVPVRIEGSSAFHLVADRHALKGGGERVGQGLVQVDLRTRSTAQSCTPRVCVRRTVAGAPHRQKLLPQKTVSRGHKLQRWNDSGRVNGYHPLEGGGTWSLLASLLGLGETSRLLLPV